MKDGCTCKIFLADDDEEDCMLFKEALEETKEAQLELASDGLELMTSLKKMVELPSAIFLDLNMPRKGGMEALREIKRDKELSKIPITVLSTASDRRQISEAYASGANCYITKPDHYIDWLIIMKGLLHFFSRKRKQQSA